MQGSWTIAEQSKATGRGQLLEKWASKGMAHISALDTQSESILGVYTKRIQPLGGPGKREAKFPRRSVLVNLQRLCYTVSLLSHCGVAGHGVQHLGRGMKYMYDILERRTRDSYPREGWAQESVLPPLKVPSLLWAEHKKPNQQI